MWPQKTTRLKGYTTLGVEAPHCKLPPEALW